MLTSNLKYSINIIFFLFSCYLLYNCNKTTEVIEIPQTYQALEEKYKIKLEPINLYKESNPKLYWFIISWLKTNYGTPSWKAYGTEQWKKDTKQRGIDCSGFSRVLQEEIYNYKIRGSSQQILDKYCKKIKFRKVKEGDLLFFKAPNSKSQSIVHIGVYLHNNYFVHATSKKSAALGDGIKIDNIANTWSDNLMYVGRPKEKYKIKD